MKLSIVILNYNVRYFLELCLRSVVAALKDIDSEIIVVDNCSTDDSCAMVKQLFPEVLLIANKENSGFSKGNNIGVAQAQGEYVCLLNPDTVVAEDTFTKILKFADEQSYLGAIGCQLIDGAGRFLPESKRNVPTPKVAINKIFGNPSLYYANHIREEDISKVDVLVGAFMLMPKAVYLAVGGLDEDYFMYGEDVDLSYKILKAGFNNFYFGDTTVIHYKGESTLRNRVYAKRFNGAMRIFYKKHFKLNRLQDVCVNLAIKSLILLNLQPKITPVKVDSVVIVSNRSMEKLLLKMEKPVQVVNTVLNINEFQQYILDCNVLTFKEIVEFLKKNGFKKSLTFRIIPYNANFALGSDNAVSRGEIIKF
ncbi:glycosyltransferase family 2 protein [Formosa sp. S-31]|uniref:glycosyltransferase family 2 protein n=1 Tax=Formosa sp. S-31 TaxID=2790949 RepID=UPI003EBFE37D